jgi:hypothetical protein
MEQYAGIDVSLKSASICVVDANGRTVREAKVASEPEALIAWFRMLQVACGQSFLTQAARDGGDETGRDGETPLDRTEKHRHDGRGGNPGLYL